MISLCVADGVEIHKEKFTYEEWEAVRKTVDLFGRVKCTEQAEMIATVLYAYDELAKAKTAVSDKEVYDAVFEWKRRWKDDKEYEVCNTIQNLAMLSLIRVSCSKELMKLNRTGTPCGRDLLCAGCLSFYESRLQKPKLVRPLPFA